MPPPSALAVLKGALIDVGFVLMINGPWLLGRAPSRDVIVINLFTGLVTFAASFQFLLVQGSALAWTQSLLYSFTYLWIALNILKGVEDRGDLTGTASL